MIDKEDSSESILVNLELVVEKLTNDIINSCKALPSCDVVGQESSRTSLAKIVDPKSSKKSIEAMLTDKLKDVSTYDPKAYGPTPFSPRDSLGSCQSAEQGDYKRLIYFYSLTTKTLSMIRLENDYNTLESTIKLTR
jgi:hypothetical protein